MSTATAPIEFIVFGEAKPAGSKTAWNPRRKDGSLVLRDDGRPVIAVMDSTKRAGRDWRQSVASAAREAYHGPLLTGAIKLTLVFIRVRPMSHYGKNSLRKSAPDWPATRPDCTKLLRSVEDALRGIVWKDDAQVCQQVVEKRWGEPACVFVKVEPLEAAT